MANYTSPSAPKALRVTSYLVLGLIFLLLVGVAVGVYRHASDSAAAAQKAEQLRAERAATGLPTNATNSEISRLLGEDGGAVCTDPGSALAWANLRAGLSNGAGGPGTRPVITPTEAVSGAQAIIKVYCPDKMGAFESYVNDLEMADTVKQ